MGMCFLPLQGVWIMRMHIKNNRTITTIDTNGTENLTIYDKNRFIKLNAVLKINNSNEIVSLQTGDVINVSGFNELKFVPID